MNRQPKWKPSKEDLHYGLVRYTRNEGRRFIRENTAFLRAIKHLPRYNEIVYINK